MTEGPTGGRVRGGCLTAFLLLVLAANPLVTVAYVMMSKDILRSVPKMPASGPFLLAAAGIFNVACALAIWRWKRWGVYGFCASSVAALAFNLWVGLTSLQTVAGVFGMVILVALVRPVWDAME